VRRPSPVLVYTSSRLGLFLVAATVLALLGMRGVLLLAVALVLSGLASYVLLSGQRDAVARSVTARAARVRRRMDESAASEDDLGDEPSAESSAESSAAEGQADGEGDGVGDLGAPGVAQDGDQRAADGPVDDGARRDDGER
jgi:hypothetical protein